MSEKKSNNKIITVIAGIALVAIAIVAIVVATANSTVDTNSESGSGITFGLKRNDISTLYGMSKEDAEKICGKPEEHLDEGEQRSFAIYGDDLDDYITYNNGFVDGISVYSSDFLEFAGFRVGDSPSEKEIILEIEEFGFYIQSVSEDCITCVNDDCMVQVIFEDGEIYSIQLMENPRS